MFGRTKKVCREFVWPLERDSKAGDVSRQGTYHKDLLYHVGEFCQESDKFECVLEGSFS